MFILGSISSLANLKMSIITSRKAKILRTDQDIQKLASLWKISKHSKLKKGLKFHLLDRKNENIQHDFTLLLFLEI